MIHKRYSLPLLFAIALHCLALFAFAWHMPIKKSHHTIAQGDSIQAVAVNEKAVNRVIQTIKRKERMKKLRAKRAKQRKLALERKKRLAREKKHLLALKKKKEAKERALKKAKAKKAAEKKLAQKKVEEKKRKRWLMDELKKELTHEKQQLDNGLTPTQLTKLEQYKNLITARIGQNWLVPDGADRHLTCQLLIHLTPDGTVQNVSTLRSSGDERLDRSARAAVLKASPLPIPHEKRLLKEFLAFKLTVRPEDMV